MFPERLRPYNSTDPANRIDWNTTARLGEPYVRETAAERTHTIQLIVDHRSKMRFGSAGESKFEFARDVALGVVATAQTNGDRIGLLTVRDDGIATTVDPTDRPSGYAELRRRLMDLEPTPTASPGSGIEIDHPASAGSRRTDRPSTDHAFGRVLHAFRRLSPEADSADERRPLARAVQYNRAKSASQSTVLITDDTDRDELWVAVRIALQQTASVFVYLTPSVCFENEQTLHTVEASERYQQFERFRRQLMELDSVTVFAVGPARQLAMVRSPRPTTREASVDCQHAVVSTDNTAPRPPAATAAAPNGGNDD